MNKENPTKDNRNYRCLIPYCQHVWKSRKGIVRRCPKCGSTKIINQKKMERLKERYNCTQLSDKELTDSLFLDSLGKPKPGKKKFDPKNAFKKVLIKYEIKDEDDMLVDTFVKGDIDSVGWCNHVLDLKDIDQSIKELILSRLYYMDVEDIRVEIAKWIAEEQEMILKKRK